MEIITGVERRRSWPLERKLAVLEEAPRGAESAASVARRHDIRPQQLYRWRRELRQGRLVVEPQEVVPGQAESADGCLCLQATMGAVPSAARRASRRRTATGSRVEIVLANGRMLRVDAGIEVAVLQQLVGVLETA
ncbi:MAG: transposase [Kiloniellaceae bacterium]